MWQSNTKETIKVISLNCAGLKAHCKDIETDSMVIAGDIIHLIETSLLEGEISPLVLPGYACHLTSVAQGKGIAPYYTASKFKHDTDYKTMNMQITKLSSDSVDVVNVYRSSKGNSGELLAKLIEMITPHKPTLITGDFNICFMNHSKNRISQGLLEKHTIQQLMEEPTHILGGHIDHVYWRDAQKIWMDPVIERYSPYYSDHDASCITLKKVKDTEPDSTMLEENCEVLRELNKTKTGK